MKRIIDSIAKSYPSSKLILKENELGITHRSDSYLEPYRFNVYHIEAIVSCLNDDDRLIIANEVIAGKKGNWYHQYMSAPTYYRHRKAAYTNFLRSLK
ncbi:MAG: hypothetical protein IKE38_01450 [Erysipelotrichaceae bacterium]|nr:hypothetical protein [Erysipelotrichaceae bacterium]